MELFVKHLTAKSRYLFSQLKVHQEGIGVWEQID